MMVFWVFVSLLIEVTFSFNVIPLYSKSAYKQNWQLGKTVKPFVTTCKLSSSSSESSSPFPNEQELAQQKIETAQSLSDFNNGEWMGKAYGFQIKSANDVTSKISKQLLLEKYYVSVSITEALSLRESYSTYENDEEEYGEIVGRTVDLQNMENNVDIDSVDGSYSLDFNEDENDQILPFLQITEKDIKLGIEHSFAVTDQERIRLFAFYGTDDELVQIVLLEEEKLKGNTLSIPSKSSSEKKEDMVDLMTLDIDNFLSNINVQQSSNDIIDTPKESTSKKSDTRMQELIEAVNKNNNELTTFPSKDNEEGDEEFVIDRHPVTLFSLCSGVWLGDVVVRDHPKQKHNSSSSSINKKKGFGGSNTGKPSPKSQKNDGSKFAEWNTGVQKIALTYRWDYMKNLKSRIDMGRSMGVMTSTKMPLIQSGTLTQNYMARGKNPEERLSVIDWTGGGVDQQGYLGILSGSIYAKVIHIDICGILLIVKTITLRY